MASTTSTKSLRAGNVINVNGARVKLEGKPKIEMGPGNRPVFMWLNMPVISGHHALYPEAKVLSIVGDASVRWIVTR